MNIDPEALLNGVHVVVAEIRSSSPEPRYRRTAYWNLPGAQKAVDRAHMAGKEAHIVLCKLQVVEGNE